MSKVWTKQEYFNLVANEPEKLIAWAEGEIKQYYRDYYRKKHGRKSY